MHPLTAAFFSLAFGCIVTYSMFQSAENRTLREELKLERIYQSGYENGARDVAR